MRYLFIYFDIMDFFFLRMITVHIHIQFNESRTHVNIEKKVNIKRIIEQFGWLNLPIIFSILLTFYSQYQLFSIFTHAHD